MITIDQYNEDEECEDGTDFDTDRCEFENPGGRSALRKETEANPRNLPCGQCREPNALTPYDVALGYVCDHCADLAEGIEAPC